MSPVLSFRFATGGTNSGPPVTIISQLKQLAYIAPNACVNQLVSELLSRTR
jgi:hypothetical protein